MKFHGHTGTRVFLVNWIYYSSESIFTELEAIFDSQDDARLTNYWFKGKDIQWWDFFWQGNENFVDDGIQIEPFNLDKEREEGYFDADGNFVEYVNDNEIKVKRMALLMCILDVELYVYVELKWIRVGCMAW